MTRIALLGPANSVHLRRWAVALAQRGHELCVLSQHPCERSWLPAQARVVWLPRSGGLGYLLNAVALRRELARWRPQLLHAHYASGYGTTMALAGFRPSLLSVWGSDVYDFPNQGRLQAWWLRRNLRSATALASTSGAMAGQVQKLLPTCGPVAVTPFGVDTQLFAPREKPTDDGLLTIGIVKTLADKYGVDLLLRGFAGLLQDAELSGQAHTLQLLIVGDGPQRAALERLAGALGIDRQTRFAGAVAYSDVPRWLQELDVYVAPSRLDSESFGVAVVEASACGLAVVVSDAGGLPEVVRDGKTGLVVPRNDVPALQAALKRLVLDPGLRARLGSQGRAHVQEHYEWAHCVHLMERCIDAVVHGSGKR